MSCSTRIDVAALCSVVAIGINYAPANKSRIGAAAIDGGLVGYSKVAGSYELRSKGMQH
jgi:hypothetical protein